MVDFPPSNISITGKNVHEPKWQGYPVRLASILQSKLSELGFNLESMPWITIDTDTNICTVKIGDEQDQKFLIGKETDRLAHSIFEHMQSQPSSSATTAPAPAPAFAGKEISQHPKFLEDPRRLNQAFDHLDDGDFILRKSRQAGADYFAATFKLSNFSQYGIQEQLHRRFQYNPDEKMYYDIDEPAVRGETLEEFLETLKKAVAFQASPAGHALHDRRKTNEKECNEYLAEQPNAKLAYYPTPGFESLVFVYRVGKPETIPLSDTRALANQVLKKLGETVKPSSNRDENLALNTWKIEETTHPQGHYQVVYRTEIQETRRFELRGEQEPDKKRREVTIRFDIEFDPNEGFSLKDSQGNLAATNQRTLPECMDQVSSEYKYLLVRQPWRHER